MGSEEAVKAEDDFGKKIEFIGVQEHSNRRDKIVRFYFTREDGKKVEFTYLSKKDMLQVLSENIGVSENEKGGILAYMQNKYKPKPIEKQSQASQGKPSQTHSSVFAQQPEQSIEQRVEQAAHGEPILSPEERFMYNLEKCTSLYDAVERALGKIMANESLDKKEIEVISTYFATSKDLPEQYKQRLEERDEKIMGMNELSKLSEEGHLEQIKELKENYEGKLGELQGENLLQKEKYEADTEHLNCRIKDLEFALQNLQTGKAEEKKDEAQIPKCSTCYHPFTGGPAKECPECGDNVENLFGKTLEDKTENATPPEHQEEVAETPQPIQEPIAAGPKEYLYTKVQYVPGWFKKYHILRGENTNAIRVRVNDNALGKYFCEVDGLQYNFDIVYVEDKKRNIEFKQEEIAPEVLEQIVKDAVKSNILSHLPPLPFPASILPKLGLDSRFTQVKESDSKGLLDDDDFDSDDGSDVAYPIVRRKGL